MRRLILSWRKPDGRASCERPVALWVQARAEPVIGPRFARTHWLGRDDQRRSRGTIAPEFCINVSLCKQRAQGKPVAGCTRSLVCSEESTRVSHYRFNRDTRPSLRNGVNGVVRAFPGVRDLIVTVVRGIIITRDLSTSPGAPGPHASAVRRDITRQSISPASIASRPTFVTTRTPLLPRRDSAEDAADLGISVIQKACDRLARWAICA
jgi:hypothetical protein